MLSLKRLRSSSSDHADDEKKGENRHAKTLDVDTGATPTNDYIEVRDSNPGSNSTESLLRESLDKVSGLENLYKKVDTISEKVTNIERKIESLDTRIIDLEKGYSFMETDFMELKQEMEVMKAEKADIKYVNEMKQSVVDLVNRSKRNNIVLHGIPEGEEGDTHDCTRYVTKFFSDHMEVPNVEIERAHRSPAGKPKQRDATMATTRPRPIHVKLLRFNDRETLLKRGAMLKEVRIRGKKVGISDDVHRDTREEHKKLMARVKVLREEGKLAFIPNSVPRVIKYKEGDRDSRGPLKTLRVSDL